MFKDSFKYYKSRNPPADLKSVIDIKTPDFTKVRYVSLVASEDEKPELGLKSTNCWNVYEIIAKPGLIFIENPFTAAGQRSWITRCVKDYSKKPNKTNLDAHNIIKDDENWWEICYGDSERAKILLPKLRWSTLGYHHNWETKKYSESNRSEIPKDMIELSEQLAKTIGLSNFSAESAIVNYYRMNSTLSGHTDHSEYYLDAPLISISFGQSAIFLIGGLKLQDPAEALLIRSGDVIVMSKGSRLRYHGVPKILPADFIPWKNETEEKKSADWDMINFYISESRVNMNIRQVLRPGQTSLDDNIV